MKQYAIGIPSFREYPQAHSPKLECDCVDEHRDSEQDTDAALAQTPWRSKRGRILALSLVVALCAGVAAHWIGDTWHSHRNPTTRAYEEFLSSLNPSGDLSTSRDPWGRRWAWIERGKHPNPTVRHYEMAITTVGGGVVAAIPYSVGPNGKDEQGEGDDVFPLKPSPLAGVISVGGTATAAGALLAIWAASLYCFVTVTIGHLGLEIVLATLLAIPGGLFLGWLGLQGGSALPHSKGVVVPNALSAALTTIAAGALGFVAIRRHVQRRKGSTKL